MGLEQKASLGGNVGLFESFGVNAFGGMSQVASGGMNRDEIKRMEARIRYKPVVEKRFIDELRTEIDDWVSLN